jgi:hypothetical protein
VHAVVQVVRVKLVEKTWDIPAADLSARSLDVDASIHEHRSYLDNPYSNIMSSSEDIQALLRFLSQDAKVPLAQALSKVKDLQAAKLNS